MMSDARVVEYVCVLDEDVELKCDDCDSWSAVVVGKPHIRVVGLSKDAALRNIKSMLLNFRVYRGEYHDQ